MEYKLSLFMLGIPLLLFVVKKFVFFFFSRSAISGAPFRCYSFPPEIAVMHEAAIT
jgi:hypothetical protein